MTTKNKAVSFDSFDIETLAADLCGKADYNELSEVEDELYEKYEISYENFEKLIKDLYARMQLAVSPLTNTPMVGFTSLEAPMWLVKKDISSEFMGALIQWLSGGEKFESPGSGFAREITSGGKVEYTVEIRTPKEG